MPGPEEKLIADTVAFVQSQLKDAEAGHDWWHIQRVWTNTRLLLQAESEQRAQDSGVEKQADRASDKPVPDPLVCELAALLHDIADSKFHGGDEEIGPRMATEFLKSKGVEEHIRTHVENIIRHLSFHSSIGREESPGFRSRELDIVQDADRLDALGAVGIARAFHYGGYKNRLLYDPEISPVPDQSRENYKNSQAPTINHFYEKLLLLKDQMNTAAARKIAEERHAFMEQYLDQFYKEWHGNLEAHKKHNQTLK